MSDFLEKIYQAEGSRNTLIKQKTEQEKKLHTLKEDSGIIELAQTLVQETAKTTQEQLKMHIEDIVQLALDTCFPDEYDFFLRYEVKRGKTEANLRFLKNGTEIDPMNAAGGGVVDVASFALRIASWSLGKTDNVIILDEPFRYLSRDLQPKAGEILKRLSEDLSLQFLIVTHQQELIDVADKVFTVTQNDKGISKAKEEVL